VRIGLGEGDQKKTKGQLNDTGGLDAPSSDIYCRSFAIFHGEPKTDFCLVLMFVRVPTVKVAGLAQVQIWASAYQLSLINLDEVTLYWIQASNPSLLGYPVHSRGNQKIDHRRDSNSISDQEGAEPTLERRDANVIWDLGC
jgi:hypothetical protein